MPSARPYAWTGHPQPAERAAYRTEYAWTGPAGTAARLTSALKGWQRIRFEATEEASDGVEAHRYSYTPTLGVLHTQIGLHGDVVVPEERIKHAMVMAPWANRTWSRRWTAPLGRPWDAELEPFRYAGEGAPVRWLHKVV